MDLLHVHIHVMQRRFLTTHGNGKDLFKGRDKSNLFCDPIGEELLPRV